MQFGAAMFFTEASMRPAELGPLLEERGFEITVGAGALAHPIGALKAVPRRSGITARILRHHGPIPGA